MERKSLKIANIYSHLNGLEFLLVHKKNIWEEIQNIIENIDAEVYRTKISNERDRKGIKLFSPVDLNNSIKNSFYNLNWHERRVSYCVTDDIDTSREIAQITDRKTQKYIIESNGFNCYSTYNQIDFVKDKIAVEVQFGKYFSVQYDLHVKHTFFYNRGDIDVGLEIIPTHKMMSQMSSGIAWYENELMNIIREGRSNPSVPIILLGIEP